MVRDAKTHNVTTSTDSSGGSELNARSNNARIFLSSFKRDRKSAYLQHHIRRFVIGMVLHAYKNKISTSCNDNHFGDSVSFLYLIFFPSSYHSILWKVTNVNDFWIPIKKVKLCNMIELTIPTFGDDIMSLWIWLWWKHHNHHN